MSNEELTAEVKEMSEESQFKQREDGLETAIESLVNSVGYETICNKACTGENVVTFAVMCTSEDDIDDTIDTLFISIESYRNGLKAIKHEGEPAINWHDTGDKEATLYWRMKPAIEHQSAHSTDFYSSTGEQEEFPEIWIIRTRLLISTASELKITDHGYSHAMRGIREGGNDAST